MTEVVAILKNVPISAQKSRLVVNQIRCLPVDKALEVLTFSPKRAAVYIKKVLNSAMANAEHNNGADIDELVVSTAYVDEARTLKRLKPRAKGRADQFFKRSCHITVKVKEMSEE